MAESEKESPLTVTSWKRWKRWKSESDAELMEENGQSVMRVRDLLIDFVAEISIMAHYNWTLSSRGSSGLRLVEAYSAILSRSNYKRERKTLTPKHRHAHTHRHPHAHTHTRTHTHAHTHTHTHTHAHSHINNERLGPAQSP